MKGTLHKKEGRWIVIYDEIIGENLVKKNQNSLPLINNGQVNGLKLYNSNEGLEVDFEVVEIKQICNGYKNQPENVIGFVVDYEYVKYAKILTKCYCGHTTYCDCGPLEEDFQTKPGFVEKRMSQMLEQASYDELQGVIDLYGVEGTLKMFKEAKPELLINRIANEEFKKVGDAGLFPNHTDKDIWVNGFNAGFWYHKKS